MKKLILTLALILCGYAISNASILTKQSVELEVGSNPVSILENPSDGMVHIFCAGIDANNNNTFDEGEDEKPSWWTYNPAGSSVKPNMVKEFVNYFVSPFKPSIIIAEGKTSFGIPFKSSKVGDNFTGEAKFEIYDAKTLNILSSEMLFESELLFKEYNKFHTISIIRKNGKDILSVVSNGTVYIEPLTLNGDAIDFTLIDLNNDGLDEIAILIDNEKLAFYKVGTKIELIGEVELDDNTGNNSTIGNLYTYSGNVYITYKESLWFAEIEADIEGNIELKNFLIPSLTTLKNPTTYLPLSDKISIITNESNDLIVHSDFNYGTVEYHRTSTFTDLVYFNGNNLYVTGEGKVYIYDFRGSIIQEPTYLTEDYLSYQPLDILPFDDNFYTVNLGIDFNFDGNIDETIGDQKPSVYSFTLRENGTPFDKTTKEMDFDFPINFPLNTNISSDGNIALPSGNMVNFYNVEDNEVYDSFDAGMYVTCAFSVLDYLVLGQRDFANDKSYIRIKNGDFIDVNTEVGANVIDCIVYQNASGFGVVSLSEGNFGVADAKINIIKLSTMGIGENTEIEVGTGGNSIVANADQSKAAIVMNGSHEVHILNLLTGKIDKTFSTSTSGYGGPRDAEFVGDLLYVSTYSNQISVFNYKNGKKVSSISIDGNSEGIAITDKYLLATNNNYSNYQPSNRIFAYDLDKITSVEEAVQTQQTIRVYPHPVSNDFHLVSDDLAGTNDIAIINSQGKIVATYNGSSNGAIALNADALGLTSGNYTAVINGIRAVRFIVIK